MDTTKTITTAYIVPALTDIASQCKIVAASGRIDSPLSSYRKFPHLWKEIGLMNSQGKLVCLTGSKALRDEILSCEPLGADTVFYVEE